MPLPRLRNIDAYPVDIEGKRYVCLKDPENIIDNLLILTPHAFMIATMLDGKKDIHALQESCVKMFKGAMIVSDDIKQLVNQLDKNGFLLSENFDRIKSKIENQFLSSLERPAYLSGKSYPESPGELSKLLINYINGASRKTKKISHEKIKGIISPHIDYNRGGDCYGYAYNVLEKIGQDYDTFVILGVAHSSPPSPYVLTRKSFVTPLGTVQTDQEVVDYIAQRISFDPFKYEIVHRAEHSIEFQAIFLKHAIKHDFKIVPILCSSFESLGEDDPCHNKNIENFIKILKETLKKFTKKKFFIISGSDLAHVGPRFGDNEPVNDKMISWMEKDDQSSLKFIKKADPLGFYKSVMHDGNKRKVCGLSSIYTTLKLLEGSKGTILNYNYASDPAGGMVSYTSAVLSRQKA
ncbi:MAG: AmmeMemoRadiSam system protein B [Planctomycetes bacterium]|nr:AmmeMemoRadiSam system protein B [Planctomycetota bacterium]